MILTNQYHNNELQEYWTSFTSFGFFSYFSYKVSTRLFSPKYGGHQGGMI